MAAGPVSNMLVSGMAQRHVGGTVIFPLVETGQPAHCQLPVLCKAASRCPRYPTRIAMLTEHVLSRSKVRISTVGKEAASTTYFEVVGMGV
jgi:hypothetical protein